MSTKCWLCDVFLTKNSSSKEHIIPKALGGKQTVDNFICRSCNSQTGAEWDASLIAFCKGIEVITSSITGTLMRDGSYRHETIVGEKVETLYGVVVIRVIHSMVNSWSYKWRMMRKIEELL